MNIFCSFSRKFVIGSPLALMAIILGLPLILSAPLEEDESLSKFLAKVTDQYSDPLVVSFLHLKIMKIKEIISKFKSSLKHLDRSKDDGFDLAETMFELLDEQLTHLEIADYFDHNGNEKVEYFIEQLIIKNKMYPNELPIQLNSSRMQKLAAFLARQELLLLANYSYPPANHNYYYTDLTGSRKVA